MSTAWTGRWRDGARYGALGLPLAFVALPLYVVLPNHYAERFGVPLATLGALLLAVRLFDAVVDPWIGRVADALLSRASQAAWLAAAGAAVVLALGFRGLFFPGADLSDAQLLAWLAALLLLTTLGYSMLSILHQAWGARLGGGEAQRAHIVAWREGLALVGVLVASVLPALAGLSITSGVFALLLAAAVLLLRRAPRASRHGASTAGTRHGAPLRMPWRTPAFRRLLAIHLVNGIASAIPATLVLFFIRDRLQLPAMAPVFLVCYFAAAAASVPLWVQGVKRFGLAACWGGAMVLAVATFAWAASLGTGDGLAFAAVCLLSGLALGADLTLPSALLAGVIQQAGHGGTAEGAYFGWWNFAGKLNLALAAGLSLPALQWGGYAPGSTSPEALDTLTVAYCLLPCALKLLAALLLAVLWPRQLPRFE